MASSSRNIDPDDMFADTRMTFGEHIEDLRSHLVRAGLGFAIAVALSFFLAPKVLIFIAKPVDRQLAAYWDRYYERKHRELLMSAHANQPGLVFPFIRMNLAMPYGELRENVVSILIDELPEFRDKLIERRPTLDLRPGLDALLASLGLDSVTMDSSEGNRIVQFRGVRIANTQHMGLELERIMRKIKPPSLTTLSIQEPFVVYFKVSLLTGLILGSPWIFYQIWSFIAAGLYPHEKKYVNMFLPFSLGLFLGGVILCEFFVIDKATEALLWFNELLDMAPDLRLNEWLGFALFMPLVFGISFQTPLVMFFVQRMGIVSVATLREKRRISWFLLAVFAAVITPSVDPVSMILLWVPMGLLYELGIWLCVYLPGRPLLEFDFGEPDEQVEV